MKKINTLILSVLICSITSFAQTTPAKKSTAKPKAAAPAQEHSKGQAAMTPEDGMKAWQAYMTPGIMHKMMMGFNGDWKEDVTFWMAPGAPATNTQSTCTNSMIMGNRYQESKHTGDMNGMPFEGTGILGYDNAKKVFVSTWIDNMGTGIMYLEGKYEEQNKTIHFSGKSVDPMTGKEIHVREEFKMIDNNNQEMEMYMTQNGKEFKSMDIKFTR
jgi:hypothetical protein